MTTLSTYTCRPTWRQTRLASPGQQRQSPLILQHDRLPEPETITQPAAAQQEALIITSADSHLPNSHNTVPQTASLTLPLEQQQQQQQFAHQGLSKSIHARCQRAPQTLLQPKKASLTQHLNRSRKRVRPESSSSACGRRVLAREYSVHTPSAPDAKDGDCIIQSAHQQAQALRSSARAVLGSLDWADSQLSCSTLHAAASAGMHSSASDGQSKAGRVGTSGGVTGCCAPAHHPGHTQTASYRQRRGMHLTSGLTSSPGQVQLGQDGAWGSRLAAAAGALCGQSDEQCAAFDGGLWAVRSPAAQQEHAGVGMESSGVADSEATWSEGGEGVDLHGSNPSLLPPKQVWCAAVVCT